MKSPSEQSNITEKALLKTLLLSLFSILFAMVCLVGLTYAWFSAHVSGGVTTMTAANFGVGSVNVVVEPTAGSSTPQEDGHVYLLTATESGASFTVTITPSGEATQGYFSLQFSAGEMSQSFCTASVKQGSAFSFTITFNGAPMSEGEASLTLSVGAVWGNAPEDSESLLDNNVGLTFDGETVVAPAP